MQPFLPTVPWWLEHWIFSLQVLDSDPVKGLMAAAPSPQQLYETLDYSCIIQLTQNNFSVSIQNVNISNLLN